MDTAKFDIAMAVLSIVKAKWSDDSIILEMYSNGREQGFALLRANLKVVFSENRRTDDVVVYAGKSSDFSMQGNVPSEEVYKNKRLFSHYESAASYIKSSLFPKDDSVVILERQDLTDYGEGYCGY